MRSKLLANAALVAAILVVSVGVAAQSISVESADEFRVETDTTEEGGVFEFLVPFRLGQDGEAYVKAVPTPWHPAVGNGTAGESGWWTDVLLGVGNAEPSFVGSTDGSQVVQLGLFHGNTQFQLLLRVHAPPGALAHPIEYRLNYALAVKGTAPADGQGGTLDPSDGIACVLAVGKIPTEGAGQEPAEAPAEERSEEAMDGSSQAKGWPAISPAILVPAALVVAVTLAVALAVVMWRRRSAPPP